MASRLTDRGVAALAAPAKGAAYHFDTEVEGLGVLVRPSGLRSFFFDWREPNGRQRRTVLGRPPVWTVGKARIAAGQLRLRADAGETSIIRGKSRFIGDLLDEWLPIVDLTRRPGTVKKYREHVERFIRPEFGKNSAEEVTRNKIEAWHARIGKATPLQANRALATLSAFLSWMARDELIDRNPAEGVARFAEDSREVFLTATEISFTEAFLNRHPMRAAALASRLSLVSGCRIGEATNIKETAPDLPRLLWVKPSAHTKQKRQHIAPLPSKAVPIVSELIGLDPPTEGELRRVIIDLRAALNRPELRLHDLRHSRASALARHGASLPMIGKILGHTSPQTTQRYQHLIASDLADLVERAASEKPMKPAS